VIHGDADATVNPVNADQIIEQLRARAEYIDPSAGPLFASDERRIDSGGHPTDSKTTRSKGGSCCEKFSLKDWVMLGAAAMRSMNSTTPPG